MKESLLYKIILPPVKLIMKLYKPTYINTEYIPKSGKVLLAGNHTSTKDPLLLASTTNRVIHYLAKIELYKGIKKPFFKGLGIIPVDRSRKNPEALKTVNDYLNDNKLVGIFPEGTINRTNDIIIPFKTGAVRMAHENDCQIVPFSITGKYKFLKKSVTICFDKPYKVTGNVDKDNKILENKICDLIRRNR